MERGFVAAFLLIVTGILAVALLYIAFTKKDVPSNTLQEPTNTTETEEEIGSTITGTKKPDVTIKQSISPTKSSTNQVVQYTITPTPKTVVVTNTPTPSAVQSPTPTTKNNNGGGPDFPIVGG